MAIYHDDPGIDRQIKERRQKQDKARKRTNTLAARLTTVTAARRLKVPFDDGNGGVIEVETYLPTRAELDEIEDTQKAMRVAILAGNLDEERKQRAKLASIWAGLCVDESLDFSFWNGEYISNPEYERMYVGVVTEVARLMTDARTFRPVKRGNVALPNEPDVPKTPG